VGDTFWVTEYRHVRSYPVNRYTGESTASPLADGEDETLYLYAPEDDPPPYGVRDEFVSTTAPGCTVHLRDHVGVSSPTMLTPLGNPIITGTVVVVEAGVEVGDPIPHGPNDPPTTVTYGVAPSQTHLAPVEDAVVIEVRDPCLDEWGYCYARQWTRQNLSGTIQWDGMLDMYYEGELCEYNVRFCTASTVFATISVKVQDRYWTTFGGIEEPIVGPWTFEMPKIAIIAPLYDSYYTTGTPITFQVAKSLSVTAPLSATAWSGGGTPPTGTGAAFVTSYSLPNFYTVSASLDDTGGESGKQLGTSMRVCVYSIHLKEVSFGGAGFHAVRRDVTPQTDYEPPHWTPSHEYPVSYRRNAKMHVTTKWSVEPAGAFEGFFMAKGNNPWGLSLPEAVASVNGTTVTYSADCTTSFPNAIALYDPLVIYWWLYTARLGWMLTGPSEDPCYVTLADPLATPFHTLLYIGCSKATGKTETTPTAEAIWGEFTDRVVRRLWDNAQMTYWFGDQMGATDTPEILQRADANGNCQAWAGLLRDCFRVQGISADRIRALPVSPFDEAILVKSWLINDPPHGSGSYPYIVGTDAFDQNGIPGQGNGNPPGAFNGHWITLCNGEYHDPSYGTAKVSGPNRDKVYEDGSLDGYGESLPPASGTGVRKNNVLPGSPSELDYQVDN